MPLMVIPLISVWQAQYIWITLYVYLSLLWIYPKYMWIQLYNLDLFQNVKILKFNQYWIAHCLIYVFSENYLALAFDFFQKYYIYNSFRLMKKLSKTYKMFLCTSPLHSLLLSASCIRVVHLLWVYIVSSLFPKSMVCIKVHCIVHYMDLHKLPMTFTQHYTIIQNIFKALKSFCVPPICFFLS